MNFAQTVRRAVVSSIFTALAFALAPACSSEGDEGGCAAGCAEDERCVDGACLRECAEQSDCADDAACLRWRLEDGSEGTYCSRFAGRFSTCERDDDCDVASGFECVANVCEIPCTSHFECAGIGYCGTVEGGRYCVRDAPSEPGGYFTTCPNGVADCADDFACVGAGPGDIDAYCTTDCTEDAECPFGFQCGSIDDGGTPRRVCEKRAFCSPCERDEDCLGVPGQICARDASGEKICTVPCNLSEDSCPWGNAAECGVWDTELDAPTCSHRFGACRGTGQGCEPCVRDSDCGAQGICGSFQFSGERYCIDLRVECDCGEDVSPSGTCLGHGCPGTPGGLEMICLAPRSADDPLGNRCIYAASTTGVLPSSPSQGGCWPPL